MPQRTAVARGVRGGASRARDAGQAALDRLTQSLEAAQAALADLRKELGKGTRDVLEDLDTTLKNARKNVRSVGRTLTKDLEQIQHALTTGKPAEPQAARPRKTTVQGDYDADDRREGDHGAQDDRGGRARDDRAGHEADRRTERAEAARSRDRRQRDRLRRRGGLGSAGPPRAAAARPPRGTIRALPARIVFARRLDPDKGPDILVEALGLLRDPPPTLILGDGRLRAALQRRVRELGLAKRVSFPGWVGDPGPCICAASRSATRRPASPRSTRAAIAACSPPRRWLRRPSLEPVQDRPSPGAQRRGAAQLV